MNTNQPNDTSDECQAIQDAIYRAMPLSRKLQLVFDACEFGRQLALAGLRMRYPSADNRELWHLWAREYLGESLYEQVYGSQSDVRIV
jgi:hypothetical protein